MHVPDVFKDYTDVSRRLGVCGVCVVSDLFIIIIIIYKDYELFKLK